MKKLYFKSFILLILICIFLILFDMASMSESMRDIIANLTNSKEYLTQNAGAYEIVSKIEAIQQDEGKSKLIIGDSVCLQMFSGLQEYNEDILIQGSNAAITMSGQYIMAKEYLDTHPEATDIYLIVLPLSLKNTYKTKWGYQYAVMPFVQTDTLKYMEPETIDIMEKTYGSVFLKPSVVDGIDASGVNRKIYLNTLMDITPGYLLEDPYEIANIYLPKIDGLCKERNVKFHLYPGPVSKEKEEATKELGMTFAESDIYYINPDYFDSILYYDEIQSTDGSHFSGDYANQECYNEKIKKMLEGTDLAEVLKFE